MKVKVLFFIAIMFICGSINAQTHHYSINNEYYTSGNNASVTAQIQIDGVQQTSSQIELGAFNGEIVTGSDFIGLYTAGSNSYYRVQLQVYGKNSSYPITFKIFDHGTESEMDYYTVTDYQGNPIEDITWENDAVYGQSLRKAIIINFQHTNTLPISAYTETGNWYLISSPLAATSVAPTAVGNMIPTEGGYDLYYFDQEQELEWVNYKEGGDVNVNPGFDLEQGKGYLYANSQAVDLVFAGASCSDASVNVTIKNVSGHRSAGWNLIGNPYASAATITKQDYYVMNANGDDFMQGSGNVAAMHGVMVYTDQATETVTFAPATGKEEDDSEMIALNLCRENGNVLDRVVVRMGEGGTLPKYVLNSNNAHVSAVMNDEEYAVVNGTNAFLIPVNFNADRIGKFTLGLNIQRANMDYLHLIDKLTGEDIDLLLENSYTFVGAPSDMKERFALRLRYNGYDGVEDIFAYQSGSDLIVAGEGTLQVFDVMGRFVGSYDINGVETIQTLPMGVYVLRMVGDGIKTQKIVVK